MSSKYLNPEKPWTRIGPCKVYRARNSYVDMENSRTNKTEKRVGRREICEEGRVSRKV